MRVLFHYLLVFVMTLLPLQGGAIAAMPAAPAVAVEHHAHAAKQAVAVLADTASPAVCCEGDEPHATVGTAHAKCNASANCCVGAVAPPVAMNGLANSTSSMVVRSSVEPAMTAFIPPTLERPPRPFC